MGCDKLRRCMQAVQSRHEQARWRAYATLLFLVSFQLIGAHAKAGDANGRRIEREETPGDATAAEEEATWLPDDYFWPEHSEHNCVGEEHMTRTCHFRNLVFDRKERKFLFFPRSSGVKATQELRDLDFYENFSFKVITNDKEFPTRERACDEIEPVYLTNALRPYSFGHTVRDFFTVMTANLHELGVTDTTYEVAIMSILPYVGENPHDAARGMRVLRKYMEWVGEGATWFHDLTSACNHAIRYIVYRDIVVGSFLFSIKPELFDFLIFPKRWGGCHSPIFEMHRDKAFKLARIPHVVPASQHATVKVLFGDKPQHDSRRIINVGELIPALKLRFPKVHFVNKVLQHMTAREQLEEMSTTTIFISPHASSSFRMVYLPNDAHAIIVGPPEQDGHTEAEAFHEIDDCWGNMTYFSVGRYHVTEPDEWSVRFNRGYRPDNNKIVKYYHWFDSDSKLSTQKLGDLIEEGLNIIRSKAVKAAR